LAIVIALGAARSVLLGAYGVLSLTLFVMYGVDKAAARRGGRRTPEIALHLFSVAGGWPGALVAQRVFRHKTRKTSFQTIFWCTVIANCAAFAWLWAALPALAG
jgi:uncharacterized membrane protein YsdA (DUF1294 family)